ncbi:hypothetical protein [Actinophytocola glycyrrhizae]|uniref:Lipoprotein n=1 Tax=Actinophytocola glycyrrhizae TaxID=2044873 RepID=A0ABV9S0U7_9PSEU
MRVTRVTRRLVYALVGVALTVGCAQPTTGRPVADRETAAKATADAVRRGIDAFQDHFTNFGDEHARVYNYLNFGDTKITTEHESFKVGDPPAIVTKRRYSADGDWSETFTPPGSPVDYIKLDEDHRFLAPTPYVSVPSLYANGFQTCILLTAWAACNVDTSIGQTALDAPEEQPSEARATEDGFEVTTGALLGVMLDEGIVSVPEEQRGDLTEPMLNTVVPVTIRLDDAMEFTGFEVRGAVTGGDAPKLEIQLEYEVLGEAEESDLPDVPDEAEITAITDKAALEQFWEKFNDRTPEK